MHDRCFPELRTPNPQRCRGSSLPTKTLPPVLWLLPVVACTTGCASHAVPDADQAGTLPASHMPGRFLASEHGLEVRQWVVPEEPGTIGAALSAYSDGEAIGAERAAVLRRNGLRFVRVPVRKINALRRDLGIASMDVTAWHGQIYQWRQLQQRRIGPAGAAVAVNGFVRRFGPGRLRLMARSWSVPMEDGVYLNLELVPRYDPPRSPTLNRLLGRRESGEILASMALEVQLRPVSAYVLTFESPEVSWPEPGRPTQAADEDPAAAHGERGANSLDLQLPGPETDTPVTVGELLFRGTLPRARGMLVFVPRIPADDEVTRPVIQTTKGPAPEP